MKLFKILAVACAIVVSAATASAAVADLPVTTIQGQKCYYYEVKNRESIYQVANTLGVTREDILRHNPTAADGLTPKMRLYFPVADFSENTELNRAATYAHAAGVTKHVVKKGETIYGIAHKYGMTPEQLIALNPSAADGIHQGLELHIGDAPENPNSYQTYTIQSGDTLYGIAQRKGITLDALLAANPGLDPLRYNNGQQILIPSGSADAMKLPIDAASGQIAAVAPKKATPVLPAEVETDNVDSADAPMAQMPQIELPDAVNVDAVSAGESTPSSPQPEATGLNVAVLLPFMTHDAVQSRTTQLYSEFFRGMVMAADTLRLQQGPKVNFRFYDTSANNDSVRAIMSRPEIADFDLIIGPDNSAQISTIIDAMSPNTILLNIFAVKDDSFRNHRNVIQTNIPHDAMYATAIDAFVDKYADYTPVFLARSGAAADKQTFVEMLKQRLNELERPYREITFSATLMDSDIDHLNPDQTPLVFVPMSGSKTEFAKISKALTQKRRTAEKAQNVTIFGYPEWVTFRDESFNEICELDATIYSRFLSDSSNYNVKRLQERYKQLFGEEMLDAVPSQGILGFDMGRFVVNGLRGRENSGIFPHTFTGLQSALRLVWSAAFEADSDDIDPDADLPTGNGGLVNEALYLINYHYGGFIDSEVF